MENSNILHQIDCPHEWRTKTDWDSHRPLLWLATKKIVDMTYEFGCGHGSTPLLYQLEDRIFHSFETNPEWANNFKNTVLIENYFCVVKRKIGLLFVDCAPGDVRKTLIEAWAEYASVIIAHDTEPTADYVYGMSGVLSTFKYRVDYRPEGFPHTTAVSNIIDVSKW